MVQKLLTSCAHENKKIDFIVHNAGYTLVGPLEHLSIKQIKAQFETKLFGAISDPGERLEKRNLLWVDRQIDRSIDRECLG